jgi:hypothetical protein
MQLQLLVVMVVQVLHHLLVVLLLHTQAVVEVLLSNQHKVMAVLEVVVIQTLLELPIQEAVLAVE